VQYEKDSPIHQLSVVLVALFASSSVIAQGRPPGVRNYDPNTVEAVQGKVVSIDDATSSRGGGAGGGGVHLNLQTEKETIPVHLGPQWFMKKQTPIEIGDTLRVTGSRVIFDGKAAIIAREIKR
jgi:hypothetical protein